MRVTLYILVVSLMGCAAAGVPYTNDPEQKIKYAHELINSNRAIPAEKLLKEAVEIYTEKDDKQGLAKSYSELGAFYLTNAYKNYKSFYEKHNEYDYKRDQSVKYYLKSEELFLSVNEYYSASNMALRLGDLHKIRDEKELSCKAYDRSITHHDLGKKEHPDKKLFLPKGYNTFIDYIEERLVENKCK